VCSTKGASRCGWNPFEPGSYVAKRSTGLSPTGRHFPSAPNPIGRSSAGCSAAHSSRTAGSTRAHSAAASDCARTSSRVESRCAGLYSPCRLSCELVRSASAVHSAGLSTPATECTPNRPTVPRRHSEAGAGDGAELAAAAAAAGEFDTAVVEAAGLLLVVAARGDSSACRQSASSICVMRSKVTKLRREHGTAVRCPAAGQRDAIAAGASRYCAVKGCCC